MERDYTVQNLTDKVATLQTRQAVSDERIERLIKDVQNLIDVVKIQNGEMDEINNLLSRWRSGGIVLLVLGSVAGWFINLLAQVFHN
jgi:predicted nucleic acid-binding protein